MKQIILIENRQEVHNLLLDNLLNSFENIEVIPKNNSSDALETMEFLPDTPLIICRDQIDEDETAKNIIQFVLQNKCPTHVIVLGTLHTKYASSKMLVSISNPLEYLDAIKYTSKMLEIPIATIQQDTLSRYSPVSINYFTEITTSCCDVFLRIRKKNEPDQYVKLIRMGEHFSKKQIIKYNQQQIEFLYIHTDKRREFINFVSDIWVEKIREQGKSKLPLDKKIKSFAIAHEIIAREINHLGLNSAITQLADCLLDNVMEEVSGKNSDVSKILQQVAKAHSHYMYKHGYMVFIVSMELIRELGMNDQNTCKALCMASLFKDISLIRNPLLSEVTSFEELESAQINQHEYNTVINHACESAYALKEYRGISPKFLELIVRHHGHPTGNGFSNAHFGNFDILDRIFFINCEFVKEFLTFNQKQKKPNQKATPITYLLRRRYFSLEISDAIDLLNKTLQKQKNKYSRPEP